MQVSSANSVAAPAKPDAAQRNRAQEYRANEEQQESQSAQRQERERNSEPVVNTQGQTTGQLVNETA